MKAEEEEKAEEKAEKKTEEKAEEDEESQDEVRRTKRKTQQLNSDPVEEAERAVGNVPRRKELVEVVERGVGVPPQVAGHCVGDEELAIQEAQGDPTQVAYHPRRRLHVRRQRLRHARHGVIVICTRGTINFFKRD